MTTYRYKGQTKDGTAVSGVIRAYDEFEAASRLRETVAVITRLEEVQEKKENIFNRPIGLKIKEKELALICSQFAIILSAGMSIQHCVEMVAAQTRNRHIRQMLEKVAEEVGAGYSMAQSFENNAPYLPKTFIETVRAGEQSGTLEECFQRLHRYYDKSAKTKAKVVSTLTSPPWSLWWPSSCLLSSSPWPSRPSTMSLPRWAPSCRASPVCCWPSVTSS